MDIIISQEQQDDLKEFLLDIIKNDKWSSASKIVNGDKNLLKILGFETPMDFLHFYDGMTMYKDKTYSYNTFLGVRKNQILVQYNDQDWFQPKIEVDTQLWGVLRNGFGLNIKEEQAVIEKWLKESYNIEGYKAGPIGLHLVHTIYDLVQV